MAKSNLASKQYLEYWQKLCNLFEVTSEQKAKDGSGILSALGRGHKFRSNEEVEAYLDKNGVDGITFRLSYSYNLNIETDRAINDAALRLYTILEQYNNGDADLREVINKIEGISVRFNVPEIYSDKINVLEQIRKMVAELPNIFSCVFKIRRCIYREFREFKNKKNDREGWGNAWADIKDWLKKGNYQLSHNLQTIKRRLDDFDKETEIVIAVLNVDVSNEDDVTNLRYFLPLCHHIYKTMKAKCKLALFSSGQQERSLLERVRQFFSLDSAIQRVVTLNGKEMPNKMDIGDLFPIICFSAAENADGEAGEHSSTKHYIEDPNASGKYDRLLEGYFLHLIDQDNYVGVHGDSIYEEDKIKIRNSLLRFLLNKFEVSVSDADITKLLQNKVSLSEKLIKRLNVNNKFSTLLFLYLMRNSIVNKVIFEKDEFGKWVLNEHIVEMTWANAKTYAEGLLQLIENAQRHSRGQVAYFGMRIYKTDPQISVMSNLVNEAQMRKSLWDKYRHDDTTKLSKIFNATEQGLAKYSDFVEFYVLDDAIDSDQNVCGIVDVIKENGTIKNKDFVDSIEKIFDLSEDDYSSGDSCYIEHYGMRWFKRHIERLNGVMEIYSPSKMCEYENEPGKYKATCVYSSIIPLSKISVNYHNLFSTEYSVLVPLSYRLFVEKENHNIPAVEDLFLPIAELMNEQPDRQPPVNLTIANYYDGHDKVRAVNELYKNEFEKFLESENDTLLIVARADTFGGTVGVEILAKALFKLLYNNVVQNKNNRLYIAVVFGEEKDFAKEFIRIFSIFYEKPKKDYIQINRYMKSVQVAVCTDDYITTRKTVNFVLAGGTLESAYATAKKLVYYDAEASLDFVPLLKFLTDSKSQNMIKANTQNDDMDDELKIEIPLFPFDLYLQDGDKDKIDSWFELQMQHRLETDLRKGEYGCKISDINVRLGSKIRIDTFYEAELLLHNVGTIKRFAYLLALDIVKQIETSEVKFLKNLKSGDAWLFLLGYENYSAVLMQEVQRIIIDYFNYKTELETGKKKTGLKIEWMIDTRSEDFPVISFDKFSNDRKQEITEVENDCIRCITILPLGSTMSTVYKLHDSFKRGLKRIKELSCQEKLNDNLLNDDLFCGNYCLVAIGNSFLKNCSAYEKSKMSPDAKYILQVERREGFNDGSLWHIAKLRPNRSTQTHKEKEEEKKVKVKYLLSASGMWSDPYQSEGRGDFASMTEKPLLKVDKTSTLLDAHFQAPLKDEVLKYYKREANVATLAPDGEKSYVKYGHILRGDNHYQFYFDFEKLTERWIEKIRNWAGAVRKKIDANAYNIVISPLQITNASFLKILLDETFGSNLHLLHINILGTSKENVRKKFEYIAREFSEIKHRGIKINFYYVDDAVCTGNGLARAWKFLLTLCNQSGVNMRDIFPNGEKFTKVFLLVNRSSYETAQTWVETPNEDWLGFINLCVPSYNTHMENNIVTCPGCRVHARYDQLRKKSATNELVGYFSKHAKKHLARNPQEYDLWLDDQILNSPSYFEWLREWVWFKDANSEIFNVICQFYNVHKDTVEKDKWWTKQTIKDFINWIDNSQTISENIDKNKIIKDILKTIKIIIAEDNYLRLRTMDEAYRELLYKNDDLHRKYEYCRSMKNPVFEPYQAALRDKIFSLLACCFSEKKNNTEKSEDLKRREQYDSVFKFISYIKVISRDYLAKNYFIRLAMYNVLCCLFKVMTSTKEELNSLVNNVETEELKIIIKNIRNIGKTIKIEATLQYRIFKVITHRLALMRSESMFQKDNIITTEKAYAAMDKDEKEQKDKEKKKFLALPSKEEMITSYLASIKTATMEENDDAMCFALWQQTSSEDKA